MSQNLDKLKQSIKQAPTKPGVYFWLGVNKEILYIGRAANLQNRLRQYLQSQISRKTKELMSLVVNLRYEESASILESVVLEAKYIKKYWPKYNIKDKDNRSFIYIVIPKQAFARPLIVRGHDLKKYPFSRSQIFGPYQSYQLLKTALRLLRPIFPYSTCSINSGKACFDYQIGLCPGACLGIISAQDYQKNIRNLSLVLAGKHKQLLQKLARDNPEKLRALKHLQDVSLLSQEKNLQEESVERLEAYDISHHAGKEAYGAMIVFNHGEANKSAYRLFKIKTAPKADDERALLEVLTRRLQHTEWPLPNLIVIDGGYAQISFLTTTLAQQNLNIPLIGISELGGDKLVFSKSIKKEQRILAENIKPTLLRMRNEAHRFANQARKRAYQNKINSLKI